jgi:glycine receptor alpha-3
MVTFIWSTNASLPKISYVKGIDVYLVCCFLMTFASVIEYAMVSYVHHRSEKRKKTREEQLQSMMQQNQMQQQLALAFQNSLQYNNINNSNHNLFSNSIG